MTLKWTHRIGSFFRSVFFVFKHEYRSVVTNGDALVIILGATLMYPILYCFLYGTHDYKQTPMAVVNNSGGSASREFVRMVSAAPGVHVVGRCANFYDAQQQLEKGEVHAVMLISRDFDKNVALHRQADVSIYVSMESFLYFKNVLLGVMDVVLDRMGDIRYEYFTSTGSDRQMALISSKPIVVQGMDLYNNEGTYASYLLPGLMLLILHQTLLIGIGIIAGRQYVRRKRGFMKLMDEHQVGVFRIVIGKMLCYMSLYGLLSFYAIGLMPKLFNLPDIGNSLDVMLFLLPFFLSTIFFALSLAMFMRNDESSLLLIVFSSVVLLLVSGPFWPSSNMPAFWQIFRWIIPTPMGLSGYIKINVLGGTLRDVAPEYTALWIQSAVYCVTAVLSYGFILGRFKKNRAVA